MNVLFLASLNCGLVLIPAVFPDVIRDLQLVLIPLTFGFMTPLLHCTSSVIKPKLRSKFWLHWSLVNAPWLMQAYAHLCTVVWLGTLGGHLARRPHWCKWFWMVWRGCLSPPFRVPGIEWHSSSGVSGHCWQCSGHQHGMSPRDDHIYIILWLFSVTFQAHFSAHRGLRELGGKPCSIKKEVTSS